MISNAIRLAQNEHVVYFLLTSYLDVRGGARDGADLPPQVKRLPIRGEADVHQRLRVLSASSGSEAADANASPIVEEAAEVLRAASERIASLQCAHPRPKAWNVVDRSQGGHVRRRRLAARMTEREAAEWCAQKGVRLERADE